MADVLVRVSLQRIALPGPKSVSNTVFRRSLFGLSNHSFNNTREQRYVLCKTINAPTVNVYEVVSEVSQYKEFMPYCVESFVNKRNQDTGKPVEAGLMISFKHYVEKFVCKVECDSKFEGIKTVVAESLTHTLFDLLYTKWTIAPHPTRPNATEVELLLRFKFHSKLYNSISSIFAKSVTGLVMKAFEKRIFQLRKESMKVKKGLS